MVVGMSKQCSGAYMSRRGAHAEMHRASVTLGEHAPELCLRLFPAAMSPRGFRRSFAERQGDCHYSK